MIIFYDAEDNIISTLITNSEDEDRILNENENCIKKDNYIFEYPIDFYKLSNREIVLKENFEELEAKRQEEIQRDRAILNLEQKKRDISEHIYKFYPAIKQAQDLKWSEAFRIKLGVYGVVNVDKKIYTMGIGFFTGKTFNKAISLVLSEATTEIVNSLEAVPTEEERGILESDTKEKLETLLGIAIRTEWAERCIVEGRKAIVEDREPVYMDFPKIT